MKYALTNPFFTKDFRDLQRFLDAIDPPAYFTVPADTWFTTTSDDDGSTHGAFYPTTDMIETSDAYELHAELPGYDKKNIKIELPNSNTLVIKGTVAKYKSEGPSDEEVAKTEESKTGETASNDEASTDKDKKESQQLTTTAKDQDKQVGKPSDKHKWLVQERTVGSFVRKFTLPIPVKLETIKASYNNGVLKVVIPKAENKQTNNQINID